MCMDPSISKSNLFDFSFLETAGINGAQFIECFICHDSCLSLIVLSCKFEFFIHCCLSAAFYTLKVPLKPRCSEYNIYFCRLPFVTDHQNLGRSLTLSANSYRFKIIDLMTWSLTVNKKSKISGIILKPRLRYRVF